MNCCYGFEKVRFKRQNWIGSTTLVFNISTKIVNISIRKRLFKTPQLDKNISIVFTIGTKIGEVPTQANEYPCRSPKLEHKQHSVPLLIPQHDVSAVRRAFEHSTSQRLQ